MAEKLLAPPPAPENPHHNRVGVSTDPLAEARARDAAFDERMAQLWSVPVSPSEMTTYAVVSGRHPVIAPTGERPEPTQGPWHRGTPIEMGVRLRDDITFTPGRATPRHVSEPLKTTGGEDTLTELIQAGAATKNQVARLLYPQETVGGSHGYGVERAGEASEHGRRTHSKSPRRLSPEHVAVVESYIGPLETVVDLERAARKGARYTTDEIAETMYGLPEAQLEPAQRRTLASVEQRVRQNEREPLTQQATRLAGELRVRVASSWRSFAEKTKQQLKGLPIRNTVDRVVARMQQFGLNEDGAGAAAGPLETILEATPQPAPDADLDATGELALVATPKRSLQEKVRDLPLSAFVAGRIAAANLVGAAKDFFMPVDPLTGERAVHAERTALASAVAIVGAVATLAAAAKFNMPLSGHRASSALPDVAPPPNGNASTHASEFLAPTAPQPRPETSQLLPIDTTHHDVVTVGVYNGHNKIYDYTQGTYGYRVLQHAQDQGFHVTSRAQADRLIDATIKFDGTSWKEVNGVDADQSFAMLSRDQIQALLAQQA